MRVFSAVVEANMRRGQIPDAPEGEFSLGSWLVPTIGLGVLWTPCVIATFAIPEESRPGAIVTMVVLAIGAACGLFKLRHDLAAGAAGPPDVALRASRT